VRSAALWLAVALGFKMGLFNIGVEGQYRLAARTTTSRPERDYLATRAARLLTGSQPGEVAEDRFTNGEAAAH
jgi:hypothetical protein